MTRTTKTAVLIHDSPRCVPVLISMKAQSVSGHPLVVSNFTVGDTGQPMPCSRLVDED